MLRVVIPYLYIRGKWHTQSIGWYMEAEIRDKDAIQQESMGPFKCFDFKCMSMIKFDSSGCKK